MHSFYNYSYEYQWHIPNQVSRQLYLRFALPVPYTLPSSAIQNITVDDTLFFDPHSFMIEMSPSLTHVFCVHSDVIPIASISLPTPKIYEGFSPWHHILSFCSNRMKEFCGFLIDIFFTVSMESFVVIVGLRWIMLQGQLKIVSVCYQMNR